VRARLDTQVHAWTAPSAAHPWVDPQFASHYRGEAYSAERLVAAMDAAGVARALVVVPTIYGWDNGYGRLAAEAYPDRLAVVARVDPRGLDIAERLDALRARGRAVGARITGGEVASWRDGAYDALLRAAGAAGLPVCVYPGGEDRLAAVSVAVRRHGATTIVVDHLGLSAPPMIAALPADPFERLPDLLALAPLENVRVKLSALPLLSREPFPFRDTWAPARAVVEAFGPERVMWGSDFTRAPDGQSYAAAARFVDEIDWLDDDARGWLLERSASETFGWPPAASSDT